VLIHDAQYTPQEFSERSDWGHCTIDYAVWVAIECRVRRLVLFHHDPKRSDEELDRLVIEAQRQAEPHGIEVLAAYEGQTLAVPLP
jgi:ribonuclease BN (tRNA processing enzyme)